MSHEEQQEEDLVLKEEDIVEVLEDDDTPPPEDMDEDMDAETGEPMIKDEEGEEQRPDNAFAGTFLHKVESSVFALALHPSFPNPPIAVSGGQDDLAYLFCPFPPNHPGGFTRETFKPITLTGHTDSVVTAAFSTDGEFVATGGMDGRVRVWRRVKNRRGATTPTDDSDPESWKYWEFITSLEAGGEIQWLRWHPKGPVLAAGCEDATVWLWQLPSGRTMTVLAGHTMASTEGVFPPPNGKQLLTSSLDSTLILWNPSTSLPEWKTTVFCPPNAPYMDPALHGITSLAISPNGLLAAAGCAGGRIRLLAIAQGEVIDVPVQIVQTLEGHAKGESVEALTFIDIHQGTAGGKGIVLVSGGVDGKLITWDSTTGRIRAEMRHPEGVTAIAPHPAPCQYLVTTACMDRTIRTWDVRTGTLMAELNGHAGTVNCVQVAHAAEGEESPLGLPRAQLIISGGDEGASLIWKI